MRAWITEINCPHCRSLHQVAWPYPGFPNRSQHHVFDCPVSGARVVFSTVALIWGEVHLDSPEVGRPVIAPFAE